MTNTIDTTEERVATVVQETTEIQKTEMSKAEICFGALMAIAAIAGMWGVVSLLISFFLNQNITKQFYIPHQSLTFVGD